MRGQCRLTLECGEFVEAHIIPKALTRPSKPGNPFIETGRGSRPKRRWASWHDSELVTRAGEDILAKIDNAAILALRKHHLVWSGFPVDSDLPGHRLFSNTPFGYRTITGPEMPALRVFFLSLLWRAAASNRLEFNLITIPESDLEILRRAILGKLSPKLSFYPCHLTQLSSRGEIHNHSPAPDSKLFENLTGIGHRKLFIYRFYLDGLICHTHIYNSDEVFTNSLGDLVVGRSDSLRVSTVTYEESRQKLYLENERIDAVRDWPDIMSKL